jgi:hypothetical protein
VLMRLKIIKIKGQSRGRPPTARKGLLLAKRRWGDPDPPVRWSVGQLCNWTIVQLDKWRLTNSRARDWVNITCSVNCLIRQDGDNDRLEQYRKPPPKAERERYALSGLMNSE